MKLKNVEIGGYIQSKKDSKQLIAGHCYQVVEKDVSDKTVRLFSVDDSFDDSLWFCVSEFRKPKPQLKQLDHSVFDGLDEKWRFAAVDADGSANGFDVRVYPRGGDKYGLFAYADDYANSDDNSIQLGKGYDTSNWQNSLIEREIKELTGEALVMAMLKNGKDKVLVRVSSSVDTPLDNMIPTFAKKDGDKVVTNNGNTWEKVIAIDIDGNPLTAKDVGL